MASPPDSFLISIVRKLEMENLKLIHERNSLQKQVLRLQRRLPVVAFGPLQRSINEDVPPPDQQGSSSQPPQQANAAPPGIDRHLDYRISLVESNGFSFYEYSSLSDSLEEYTLNAASTDKIRISSLPNSSSSSSSSDTSISSETDDEYHHQATDLFHITRKDLPTASSSRLRAFHCQSDTNLTTLHRKELDSTVEQFPTSSRNIAPPKIFISRREILPADRMLQHRESSLGESTSTSNKVSPYITAPGDMETSLTSGGLSASLERSLFSADSAVKTHRKFSLTNEAGGSMGVSHYTVDESTARSPIWGGGVPGPSQEIPPPGQPSQPMEVATIPLDRTSRVASELRALVKQVGVYTYVGGKVYLTQCKSLPMDRKVRKGEGIIQEVDPDRSLSSREEVPGGGDSLDRKQSESSMRMGDVHWMRGGPGGQQRGGRLFQQQQELSETVPIPSGTSTSYYSPPDEPSNSSATHSIVGEPSSPSKAKVKAGEEVSSSVNGEQILWSGFIFKMSSKFKFWTRFWCQIRMQSLMLFKVRQTTNEQRAHRVIPLTDITSLQKSFHASDYCTVEILLHGKVHIFCGHSANDTMKIWRILHRSIRRCQALEHLRQCQHQLTHRGWLRRIKQGHAKRLWCILVGRYIIYFRASTDPTPTGYKDLSKCTVKAFYGGESSVANTRDDNSHSSNAHAHSDSEGFDVSAVQKTLAVYDSNSLDPVYFLCASDTEFQQWEQKLRMATQPASTASRSLPVTSEKAFRQLFKNPDKVNAFYHETEPLSEPLLLSTPTEYAYLAVNISRCLVRLSHPGKDCPDRELKQEKVRLIQDMARMCFQEPQLKDEMYMQMIKQTRVKPTSLSRYRRAKLSLLCNISRSSSRGQFAATSSPSVGTSRLITAPATGAATSHPGTSSNVVGPPMATGSTSGLSVEVLEPSIRVMWECLCIFISIFLPSRCIIDYMIAYLEEVIATQPIDSDTAKYAHFAVDQIADVKNISADTVLREEVPSYFEVNSISLRNPYTFSRPFSLPIYLPTGTYQVVSFDSLTKVSQIVESTRSALLLDEVQELKQIMRFGLYCSELDGREMLFLCDEWNMCDVICRYEMALSHLQRFAARPEEITLQFYFRIRWWRRAQLFLWLQSLSSNKETLTDSKVEVLRLLLFQTHEDVFLNKYHIALEDKCRLSALFCHAIYGPFQSAMNPDLILERVLRQCVVMGDSVTPSPSPEVLSACLQTLREVWCAASATSTSDSSTGHSKNAFLSYFEFLNSISVDFFAARHFSATMELGGPSTFSHERKLSSSTPGTVGDVDTVANCSHAILIPHSTCLVIHQLMSPQLLSSTTPHSPSVLRQQLRAGRQVTSRRISLENVVSFGGTHKDTSIFFVFSQGNTVDASLVKECYTLCTICHVTELLLTLKDLINF